MTIHIYFLVSLLRYNQKIQEICTQYCGDCSRITPGGLRFNGISVALALKRAAGSSPGSSILQKVYSFVVTH